MDTYSMLRQIADSWVLLAMVIFFIGAVIWAFRPGSTASQRDSADIPFRNEQAPVGDKDENSAKEAS